MKRIIPLLILSSLIFVIYSNTLKAEFVFDDYGTIIHNPNIHNLNIESIWKSNPLRFFSYFSFAVNFHLSKLDVTSYHFVNILIHIFTSISLYLLLKQLIVTPNIIKKKSIYQKLPLITTLLFAVHPIQTQAITYITQRMASLAGLFFITALLLFVKTNASKYINKSVDMKILLLYLLFTIFSILAFFTKQNTFTLPLAFFITYLFFFNSSLRKQIKKIVLLSPVLITAAFIAVGSFTKWEALSELKLKEFFSFSTLYKSTGILNHFSSSYFFTQFKVIIYYIKLLIFPVKQNLDYDFPLSYSIFEPKTFISLLLILSIILIGVRLYKNYKLISFGIFFFLLTLSIESSIFTLDDVIYEHRLYLPSIGFFIAITATFFEIKNYLLNNNNYEIHRKSAIKRVSFLLIFSLILILSILTITRNKVWNTKISIWEDTITKSPNKARPYNNLGIALLEKNQYLKAVDAFTISAKISKNPQEYLNLGIVYFRLKQYAKALENYKKATDINSNYFEAYNAAGFLYLSINREVIAKEFFEKSLEIDKNNPQANFGLNQIDNKIEKTNNSKQL